MNKSRRTIIFNAVIFFVLAIALCARAEQPLAVSNDFTGQNMVLLGKALKKFLTFRVVTVQLYIKEGHTSQEVLSNIAKRLEVNYHVNIPKQELDRATKKGIEQNFSRQEVAALMPQIDQINSYYPDIKSGDQIVVTYVPGLGSQVMLNGQPKGIVPTEEFANAFFSIWVGENPVDQQAKLKLLGSPNSRKLKGDSVE